MLTPLFFVAAGLYGLASALFLVHLFGRQEGVLRVARLTLVGALLVHLGHIGFGCTQEMNPLRDIRGALSLAGLLVGVGYILTTVRSRFAVIGGLVAPLALALLVSSRLTPAGSLLGAHARTAYVLGRVHIALSALGVAIFGIAAAVAMIYLFQEAALKNKRLGAGVRRTPPLNTLDDASRRLITVGFPVFTLAVVTGLVWMTRLRVEGVRLEHAISAITWTIFAALIVARATWGWRGRRAAVLTIVGFLATVVVLLVYMTRRIHG